MAEIKPLKNNNMTNLEVDDALTPDNCEEKGFQWRQDVIYDPDAPEEANQEFVELAKKGWKLGKSASIELAKNGGVGLYKPLKFPVNNKN
jgi:hypothetical protein